MRSVDYNRPYQARRKPPQKILLERLERREDRRIDGYLRRKTGQRIRDEQKKILVHLEEILDRLRGFPPANDPVGQMQCQELLQTLCSDVQEGVANASTLADIAVLYEALQEGMEEANRWLEVRFLDEMRDFIRPSLPLESPIVPPSPTERTRYVLRCNVRKMLHDQAPSAMDRKKTKRTEKNEKSVLEVGVLAQTGIQDKYEVRLEKKGAWFRAFVEAFGRGSIEPATFKSWASLPHPDLPACPFTEEDLADGDRGPLYCANYELRQYREWCVAVQSRGIKDASVLLRECKKAHEYSWFLPVFLQHVLEDTCHAEHRSRILREPSATRPPVHKRSRH